jgi:hypothetical protein
MKSLLRNHAQGWIVGLMVMAAVLAGCAPDATAEIISPQLGEQLYAKEVSGQVEAAPTPEPRKLADMTPEEINAGLPADFAAALAEADSSKGETIALTYGCIGCHAMDPNQQLTGPTWYLIGDVAANQQPGVSPANYLYTSIVDPNAYVVPDYPAGVMPQNFGELIPPDELADMVAYLLAQHE